MSKREFNTLISGLATEAAQFVDETLSPERAIATSYYLGEKFGNEEEGRSQYVETTVRDSILGLLPSALRVIFGAEHPVEFVPTRKDTVAQAAQATDYVRHVFSQDNNGFMLTHGVFKDGLVRKLGVFKWGWDDTSAITTFALKNIPQSQLELLVADDAIELLRAEPNHPGAPAIEADGQVLQPAVEPTFDIEVKHSELDGRARIWNIPPDEFLVSKDARDLDGATLVGHRPQKTTSELLAMGVSQKVIDEHGGVSSHLDDNEEAQARQAVMGDEARANDVEAGEANELHDYAELFVRVDYDGDGIAELRRVCTIGPMHHVISNEPAHERPFAIYCPDPEPHTLLGQSWADRLMALQKMQSSIVRGVADSLALSIFPRLAYDDGMVNPDDLANTEIGAAIRKKPGATIQEISHTFVGKEAFPLLQYLEDVKERRTGQSKGAMGLDADALQSTEKAAAGAAITEAQGQTELLVRLFAEMTLKPLMRGILRMLVVNRPKKKMARLRGEWVEVDPRAWDANMDVTVNVALGTTLVEQKIAALLGIAAKQELVLTTLGAQNPLVTPAQYSNTLRKLTELNGFKDVDSYFGAVPADWAPPAPQGPPPDPMVAVKMQELQLKSQQFQAESMLESQKLQLQIEELVQKNEQFQAELQQKLAIAQEEIRLKLELGAAELELKYKTQIATEELKAKIQIAVESAKNEREAANNQLQHERTLLEAHQHDEQMHRKLDIDEKKADKPAGPTN